MVTKAYPRMFAGLTNVDQAWTETQTGPRWALTGGAAYFALSSGNPFLNWDSNDYSVYDITANSLNLLIGGTTRHTVSATGMTLGGDFTPITTETHDLGSPTFEWDNLYSQNAVTVSDERRKIDLGIIDGQQALNFFDALDPRLFRFKDTVVPARTETVLVEAVDADGIKHMVPKTITHPESVVPHKRPHSGFFAQQVKEAMTAAGIEDCGVYAYDPETDTHELRLFEMVAWLAAAVKELAKRPPARVTELETIPEPTPDPEPETHFADLMLADETAEDAKTRLSQRLKELRHYLIAPEIKVNEDGSVGLTPGEQSELQDLERRQTLGRWLDA